MTYAKFGKVDPIGSLVIVLGMFEVLSHNLISGSLEPSSLRRGGG